VQLECDFTRQYLDATSQRCVEDFHPVSQRFKEALFFCFQYFSNTLCIGLQLWISLAHLRDQIFHQLVEERFFLAQLVAVTNRATDDAALYIAATFVRWNHAVGHQERSRADVIRDHPQGIVFQIRRMRFAPSCLDQGSKNINLVITVHALQNRSQTFQTHAGIDARCRQWFDGAVFRHVELHEHVVPDFDEAIAVFIRAARRTTRNVRAVIVENFRAWAARASVRHHPEVVGFVAPTFVIADANHAFRRQTDFLGPDVVGFLIFEINSRQQLLARQAINLGQQFPRPFQRIALEVIAEAPVAQHFKKCVVTCGVADVFQIVVFAAGAQAGLHRSGACIRTFVFAQKHVLELDHARVGEHQGRVVAGYQRAGRHDGVAFGLKELQEFFADFGRVHVLAKVRKWVVQSGDYT